MPHYVTFIPNPVQDPEDPPSGDLVFECDEPKTAPCQWDSTCDCEGWIVEHDDYGTFHTPIGYPGEDPGECERHDMALINMAHEEQQAMWQAGYETARHDASKAVSGARKV